MKPEAPGPGWSCWPELLVTSGSFGPVGSVLHVVAVDVLTGGVGQEPVGAVERVGTRSRAARRAEGRLVGRGGVGACVSPGAGTLLKLLPIVNGGLASSKVMSMRPPSSNAADCSISGM